jgi:hypothetical protein
MQVAARERARVVLTEQSRFVVELARASRATRAKVVANARAERRRSRRLRERAIVAREENLDVSWRLWSLTGATAPPSTIPLSWAGTGTAEEELEVAIAAADECAAECIRALPAVSTESRKAFASVSGACSLAANRGRDSHPDTLAALGLCVRVIESNRDGLDQAGSNPEGVLAASAARRCARDCARALAASYVDEEE